METFEKYNNQSINDNPYQGIYPYTSAKKDYFWGRDQETKDIANAIMKINCVIMTGYSGCGKTSLINAGLLPYLQDYNFHVIRITPREVYNKETRTRFAYDFWYKVNNKINNTIDKIKILKGDAKQTNYSLWGKMRKQRFIDENGIAHYFVVILDQFEELFQFDLNEKQIRKLFATFEILIGSYTPNYAYINDFIYKENADNSFPDENNIIFPKEDEYHCDNLSNNHRFVISIRKDFLFDLQFYAKYYPFLDNNIKYVQHLDDDTAKIVIESSAKIKNGKKFICSNPDEDPATLIIESIIQQEDFDPDDGQPDYRVDTMLLSVVLFELWEKSADKIEIDVSYFEKEFEEIVSNFYNKRIESLKNGSDKRKKEKKQYIEDIISKINLRLLQDADLSARITNLLEDKKIVSKTENEVAADFKKIVSKTEKEIAADLDSIVYGNKYNIDYVKESVIRTDDNIYEFNKETVLGRLLSYVKTDDTKEFFDTIYKKGTDDVEIATALEEINNSAYGSFNIELGDNGEVETKHGRKEIVEALTSVSLNAAISICEHEYVKGRLWQNLDKIVNDMQKKLVSDNGLYRRSAHVEDICAMFDCAIYGTIDSQNKTSKLDFLVEKKIISDEHKQNLDKLDLTKADDKRKFTEELNKIVYKTPDENTNARTKIAGVIKDCKLFVEINKGGKEPMIEFRHDRLCEWANKNIDLFEIREKNAKRYSANVYFTPKGRLKERNCFVDRIFGPWDSYSSIVSTLHFLEGNKYDMADFDTDFIKKFQEINYDDKTSSLIVSLSANKDVDNEKGKEFYRTLPENFTHIRVKIIENRIYNISFETRKKRYNNDEDINKVKIPTGYHKVRFYYDEHNRMILKEFCERKIDGDGIDTGDISVQLPEGMYNAIYYRYDDNTSKFPSKTYFCNITENLRKITTKSYSDMSIIYNDLNNDIDIIDSKNRKGNKKDVYRKNISNKRIKYISEHSIDGNYGFRSDYDSFGREIKRTFIGKTNYGFDQIKFKYKTDNVTQYNDRLDSVSFFNLVNDKPAIAYYKGTDVHIVKFDYYDDGRVKNTRYYLNKIVPCEKGRDGGIIGEEFAYTEDCVESTYIYADKTKKDINKVHISKRDNSIASIEWLGKDNNGRIYKSNTYTFNYNKIEFKLNNGYYETHYYATENKDEYIYTNGNMRKLDKYLRDKYFAFNINNQQIEEIEESKYTELKNTPQYAVWFKMIYVQNGKFTMGFDDQTNKDYCNMYPEAKGKHEVELSDYFIGETTVTQLLWKTVMGIDDKEIPKCQDGDNYPIYNVSWKDANAFIKKLNNMLSETYLRFSLPTEAQWEYAARDRGETNVYSGSDIIDNVAVYKGNKKYQHPSEVRSKNATHDLHIYDMSGNVQEWCSDYFDLYQENIKSYNPKGPNHGYHKVLRGGGWKNKEAQCRVYHRYCAFPDTKNSNIGFRLVLEVEN